MFPTQSEKERSRQTENNYALFRGRFGTVLNYFRTTEERKNQLEVIQNLAGAITRIWADLMFLRPPVVSVKDTVIQERVRQLWFRSELDNELHESAHAQSYAGFTAFETRLEDGEAYIDQLNPATVFPQFSNMSTKAPLERCVISWNPEINGTKYRFSKIHTIGHIDYKLDLLDANGDYKGAAHISAFDPYLPEAGEDTGLDYIPVYIVNNHKTGSDTLGISDYDDLRTLLQELTRVLSQIATQLHKHANAKLAVPPGVLDENGRVIAENLEMIQVSNDEDGGLIKPEYITNGNPLIDQAFKEAEALVAAICRVSECSSTLLDLNVAGGVEKVGALRLRMLRTLAKVERKLRPYDRVLREMIADALAWENSMTKIQPGDIDIKFSNGLPEDALELAQLYTTRYTAGLTSRREAIRVMDGLEGEPLEARLKEITDEEEAKRKTVGEGVPAVAF